MKTLRWFLPCSVRSLVIILSVAFIAGSVTAAASERLISLEIRERPLQEVLQRLAGETGYKFMYDSTWSNHLVSVRLEQVAVQAGLRQIFSSLNHALVFLPDRTIKILIMEKTPSPGAGSSAANQRRAPGRRPPALNPDPPPVQQPDPPAASEPSSQAVEGGNSAEANVTESQPASN